MIHLVTGGAGFIGSHVVEELVRRGARVRVVDNLVTGREENLAPVRAEIEFVRGDLGDRSVCARVIAGVDTVFHLAALPSVPRSVRDPLASHAANTTATLNLLWEARGMVRRFVYASSSSVYGAARELPKREELTPQPMSPYAVSKLAGEQYARTFQELYGIEVVSLRYFNVFGPRQDPGSEYAAVVPRFIVALASGRPVTIFGDGTQSRDFTHVSNVVRASLLAGTAPGAVGRVYNIAAGRATSVNQLANVIAARLGVKLAIRHEPARPGEVRESWADVSRAERELGYRVEVGLEDGIQRTVEWYRENS